jgi:hypothetical protein
MALSRLESLFCYRSSGNSNFTKLITTSYQSLARSRLASFNAYHNYIRLGILKIPEIIRGKVML